MNSTTTKACGFAHGIETGDRLSVSSTKDPAVQISLNATQAFARQNKFANRDQWTYFGLKNRLEVTGADAVATILAKVGNTT